MQIILQYTQQGNSSCSADNPAIQQGNYSCSADNLITFRADKIFICKMSANKQTKGTLWFKSLTCGFEQDQDFL